MWRNYLIVGIRALLKNRVYAFINITGLALGIAACLLILGFVRYEFSYDSWLLGAERAFQLQDFYLPTKEGGEDYKLQITSFASGIALKKDFPQVERAVFVKRSNIVAIKDGQPTKVENSLLVDGALFDVLRVPFVYGDAAHSLNDPHALAVSETTASTLFGPGNPVGRTITLISDDLKADYRVTGVYRDLPRNTSLTMSMVARFDPHTYFAKTPQTLTGWDNQTGGYYVRLAHAADADLINAQLDAWKKRNIPRETIGEATKNPAEYQDFKLTNVRDVHLGKAQDASFRPGNDKTAVLTFGVIALVILGMACVNFTNLATARATQRAREVALRKVLGATRRQLITQFLGESMLISTIAMLVALAIVELTLPVLNTFLDADIQLHYFGGGWTIVPVIGLTVLVGLAGGLYPAFVLSRFEPARVLKANKSGADAQGSGRLRNVLVIGQFAVSIGLIICTSVVYAQTVYARTADGGYRRDGLLEISSVGQPQAEQVAKSMMEELRRIPGVTAVGRTTIGFDLGNNSMMGMGKPGSPDHVQIGSYGADPDFFRAIGTKLIAGRTFSENQAMDDSTTESSDPAGEQALVRRGTNMILSVSATRRLGFAQPQDAIGAHLAADLVTAGIGQVPVTVIGVVDDVRYRSVRDPMQPIAYYYQTRDYRKMEVRYESASPRETYDRVQAVWKRMVPDIPFDAKFVDDMVRNMYNADEARAQLFGAFALLAVVIGCLGLFGLAAFTADRRTKEIGIRKVLGARTGDIIRLLVWQFTRPVLIANVIAWPIAWWVMRNWLNGFDTRIALTPVPFLAAGVLALVIAAATIASHAIRVAQSSPIKALRYE
jgi:putative ABC transport system permease protein